MIHFQVNVSGEKCGSVFLSQVGTVVLTFTLNGRAYSGSGCTQWESVSPFTYLTKAVKVFRAGIRTP